MEGDGFDEWYRREHPRLLTSLTVLTRDATLAVDIADEAFARACERWARVAVMDSPGGWTYRTALNVLRRRHRRHAMEARILRRAVPPVEQRPADWSAEVWDALRSLPERQRVAVALRFVADLPSIEVARVMGIAPGTVASTLSAARARLALLLADPQEATDG